MNGNNIKITISGKPGSGKTLLANLIGTLLFINSFKVEGVSHEELLQPNIDPKHALVFLAGTKIDIEEITT